MIKESELSNPNEISLSINAFACKYIRYIPPSSNGKDITNILISGHAYSDGES